MDLNHEAARKLEREALAVAGRSKAAAILTLYHRRLEVEKTMLVSELAAEVGISPSAMSHALEHLVNRGMVERRRVRGVTQCSITPRGVDVVVLLAYTA
jgi:DNA-binding MarR family transcriptional regulator